MTVKDELEKIRAETPDEDGDEATEEETTPDAEEDEEEAEEAEARVAPPFDPSKLEAELKRHAKAMERVLGAGWVDMQPCDKCDTAGYYPSDYDPPPPMLPVPGVVRCPSCNGWGRRTTPAVDPSHQTEPCTLCRGMCYVTEDVARADQHAREVAANPPPPYIPPAAPPPPPMWDAGRQVWVDASGQILQTSPQLNGPLPG